MTRIHGFGARRVVGLIGSVTLLASTASASEVLLRGGGRLKGMIVQRTDRVVVMEIGPGVVTLPMSRVERIIETPSALEKWRARCAAIADGDLAGWVAAARWARDNELGTQARSAWERVLSIDSENAAANEALGRVRVGGRWMSMDEANRAQGLVPFDGRWLSPAERDSLIRAEAATNAAREARREAEARLREAEARAREAEARAHAAEETTSESAGLPLWLAGPGYVLPGVPPFPDGDGPRHPDAGNQDRHGPGLTRPAQPPPTTPASSIGPISPVHRRPGGVRANDRPASEPAREP